MTESHYTYFDEARSWTDRAHLLELVRIAPEAPDVATFTFRAAENAWFRYMPGQFITLELPVPGGPVLRTYTLSSSPSRPLSAAVTVKAQSGSIGTRWMLDHLKVGDRLRAYGPAGEFSFHLHPAKKYLFISAGSGVTPMMSMVRWIEDHGEASDIAFIHCARRPQDILFRRELEGMAAGAHPFALAFIVKTTDKHHPWFGLRGRLNRAILDQISPDFLSREIFCCGPALFMQAVRDMLVSASFDMAHYHEERFHPLTDQTLDPETPADGSATAGNVLFSVSAVEAQGESGDTILQIARSAGLNIPTGCTMGLCGTCKVRRISGETVMNHNGGIRDEDIDAGYVLACCTKPVGRVEIEA